MVAIVSDGNAADVFIDGPVSTVRFIADPLKSGSGCTVYVVTGSVKGVVFIRVVRHFLSMSDSTKQERDKNWGKYFLHGSFPWRKGSTPAYRAIENKIFSCLLFSMHFFPQNW